MAAPFVITVPDAEGLDTAWQLLRGQDLIGEAEIHLAGRGLVWRAWETGTGSWSAECAHTD